MTARTHGPLLAAALLASACSAEVAQSDTQHLDDGPPLAFESYDVLFTNPACQLYPYGPNQSVSSVSGAPLTAKPLGAYCTSADLQASGSRPESPQHRLIEWIDDPSTERVFFAALSFSNDAIRQALCRAVTERNVEIDFVLDSGTDRAKADALLACQPGNGDPALAPTLHTRGGEGGLSLQHNKMFVINPHLGSVKIAFGSGNISSGLVLHHENWHFVTVPAETHFAQAHLCAVEGLLEHGRSKADYMAFMQGCKSAIAAKEESDIKSFFIPGDMGRSTNTLIGAIDRAVAVDVAAHRFTHSTLVSRLKKRLQYDGIPVRFVADDDLYWAGQGQIVGGNEPFELDHVSSLAEHGLLPRYVETNHGAHLLHHNKAMVLTQSDEADSSVFCGAGNFTKSAFRDNFENFYSIKIPHVVARFREQYDHLFFELATAPEDMPAQNVLPPTPASP